MDFEGGGDQSAGGVVAAEEGIYEPFTFEAGDGHLAGKSAAGRAGAEGFATGDPIAIFGAFEIGDDKVGSDGAGCNAKGDEKVAYHLASEAGVGNVVKHQELVTFWRAA